MASINLPRAGSSFVKLYSRRHGVRFLASTAQAKVETRESKAVESSSFVTNLFCGQARVNNMFPYPNVLTSEDQSMVSMVTDPVVRLYENKIDPISFDVNETFDENLWETIKEMGGFGIQVPPEYGGIGMNNTQYALLAEHVGTHDLAIGIALGAHQSIGYKGLLLFGTDEQKQKYLPDLASGRKIAAFALTEPGAGSDAAAIKSRAELSPDGKHYILNGSKIWISNGSIAEFFTVFAKTPVKTADGEVKDKVTAFLVERSFGGLSSGPPEKKLGIKASNTAEVYFDNVPIPVENVLGQVGGGFKIAMMILNSGRFGMGGALTGAMKTLISKATEFANQRATFGNKIATYGTIQEKLARMAMAHYITESMAFLLSGMMDKGVEEYHLEAAISKVFASDSAWFVADEALQIYGGMGYMRSAGIEKYLRDIRIFRIFEGANEIMRLFVALAGLQHAGGHLQELQKAFKNPVANLGMILGEGTKRVRRAVGLSSGPSIAEYVHPNLAPQAALVSKAIENFGASVEHLLIKYNKNIIHEQFLLNRLGNSAIDLYSMTVALSRVSRALQKNLSSAEHETNLAKVICSEGATRIQSNLSNLRATQTLNNDATLKKIADSISSVGGVVQNHPLD